MDAIKVTGKLLTGNTGLPLLDNKFADILTVSYAQEVQIGLTRGGDNETIELAGATDDTVLELEFEGGYKRWVRAGDLKAQTVRSQSRSATDSDAPIDASSFDIARNRGAVGLMLKFLRVLNIDPVGVASNAIADKIVEQLETKRILNPGVYRCADTNALPDCTSAQAKPIASTEEMQIDTSKPVLLFLHGTFSSTQGSFRDLWESRQGYNASAWLQRLFAPYNGQVFTLEHRTLTVSPTHNALQVLRLLPPNTRLHIISHSRGGLVGELLCQGKLQRSTRESGGKFQDSDNIFAVDELKAFATAERQTEREELQEIENLLQDKQIVVERFVRVACPARGTVLASARIEDGLSILFNVLNLIPVPYLREIAEFVRLVLMAVLAKRAQPEALPGLEAMSPSSPLIRLLNRPDVQLASNLTVIAGNVKASTLLGYFKEWTTECFFGEENDYVVNTASMYGGGTRTDGAYFYPDQRDESSHFAYFRNDQVLELLINALRLHPDTDSRLLPLVGKVGTKPTRSAQTVTVRAGDKVSTVYFIPGFMGSNLLVNDSPVWLDMGALAWGDFSSLKAEQAGVKPGAVLENAYRPLLTALERNYQVETFPYDWRRSLLDAGRRLGETLERALDQAKGKGRKLTLRILAHSTGGLVLKSMMSETPGVWKRLQDEADCRCVLLGTALQGTYAAAQILLGQHRLTRLLVLSGGGQEQQQDLLLKQFAEYPGLLEQLPSAWLEETAWRIPIETQGGGFNEWPASRLLVDAKRVRDQLDAVRLDPQRVLYVHGVATLTPSALVDDHGNWRFRAVGEGDGVTLWNTSLDARDAKVQQWFMPVEHGRMASHPDYIPALLRLLMDGSAQQLDRVPPRTSNIPEQWLPLLRLELFPDETEIQAAALGYHTSITQEELRPQVEVKVTHGDLEYAVNPVMVGHYEGDSILRTEQVLDKCLNGRLTELLRLGKYPGGLKTSTVLFNTKGKRPAGAVIVGLGDVGKLSSGELVSTFSAALIDYALAVRAARSPADKGDYVRVPVSTLLVGSVGGGGIDLADSITSILRAVGQANLVLGKTERSTPMRIDSVEFIEVYEDRAVEAARLVRTIVDYPEFRQEFTGRSLMGTLPGSRSRVMYREPTGWWRRLQIEEHGDGLKYTALTDRARAELVLQSTQRKLVDQFIEKAVSSSESDEELGNILFELLLPSEMKEQAPNTENMVLVLDEAASSYPWELLYDRRNFESQPLSVRSGVLRQLMVGQFTRAKRSVLERSALVVGDPPANDDPRFPRLDAANKEAEAVYDLLKRKGFSRVTKEIGTDAQAVLKSLLTADYRVLHLAGHGVYRFQPDSDKNKDQFITGMVLGNGIYLTAVEIGQMSTVPDFVFVNCCHLAHMDAEQQQGETASNATSASTDDIALANRSRLAASFAQELIKVGVRAIIAAGWAINDDAANVFSLACYDALLQGYPFGKAVLLARRATWQKYPSSNTWGAYQCYGDPEYRLLTSRKPEGEKEGEEADPWHFVAEVEVVTELNNLINSADTSQADEYPELQTTLKKLHAVIPLEWLGHVPVLYALGRAYGKLEMYAEAIAAYQTALNAAGADYPLTMLEDKASFQTAWALACTLGKSSPPDGTTLEAFKAQMLKDSEATLTTMMKGLGESLTRMEELGKFYKRKAIMSGGEERTQALQSMEDAYRKAYEFALKEAKADAGYPLINWLTTRVVRALCGHTPALDLTELNPKLTQARQLVTKAEETEPTFLTGITKAELALLNYLRSARLDEMSQIQRITEMYSTAVGRGAAPRKVRYMSEHVVFLRTMLSDCEVATDKGIVVANLQEIERKLPA
ncbi:MAG: CHAT domain-containing protein [Thiothrix sp.]|uniref:DUF7379 domain-containing protein n=1 Tax=Thiothrix sp. TaxID=1032 RepID=UPI0026087A54|nr:CHAT domain-containing protein [Thiothrix sp.]MDD5393853.1 CHAT domain-containing protein [Thiothrix sp.]